MFGSGEHNFSTRKNEQNDLWIGHFEDESWEDFGVVPHIRRLLLRLVEQRFEFDLKFDVVRGHNILNHKICQTHLLVTNLFELFCVLARRLFAILFTFSTCANHFARTEN